MERTSTDYEFPLVFVSSDGRRKRLVKTDWLNAVIFPDWR